MKLDRSELKHFIKKIRKAYISKKHIQDAIKCVSTHKNARLYLTVDVNLNLYCGIHSKWFSLDVKCPTTVKELEYILNNDFEFIYIKHKLKGIFA